VDKIKNSGFFRIISLVLILAFVALDISWAYPPGENVPSQTLATWSNFQQSVFVKEAGSALVIRSIADNLFGNPEEGGQRFPLRNLGGIVAADLAKISKKAPEIIRALETIDVSRVATAKWEGGKFIEEELDKDKFVPDDAILLVPYRKDGKDRIIQIALKGSPNANALIGEEASFLLGERFVVRDVPKDWKGPAQAPAEVKETPKFTVSEPVAVVEIPAIVTSTEVVSTPQAPKRTFTVRAIINSAMLMILTPLYAFAGESGVRAAEIGTIFNRLTDLVIAHPVIACVAGVILAMLTIKKIASFRAKVIYGEKLGFPGKNIFKLQHRFILKHPDLKEETLIALARQITKTKDIEAIDAIITKLSWVEKVDIKKSVWKEDMYEQEDTYIGSYNQYGPPLVRSIAGYTDVAVGSKEVRNYTAIDLLAKTPIELKRLIDEESAKQQGVSELKRSYPGLKKETLTALASQIARTEDVVVIKAVIERFAGRENITELIETSRFVDTKHHLDYDEGYYEKEEKVIGERLNFSKLDNLVNNPVELQRVLAEEQAKLQAKATIMTEPQSKNTHAFTASSGYRAVGLPGSVSLASFAVGATQYIIQGDFTGFTIAAVLAGAYFGWAAMRYFRMGKAASDALVKSGLTRKEALTTAIARNDGYRHPAYVENRFITLHEGFEAHWAGMLKILPIVSIRWIFSDIYIKSLLRAYFYANANSKNPDNIFEAARAGLVDIRKLAIQNIDTLNDAGKVAKILELSLTSDYEIKELALKILFNMNTSEGLNELRKVIEESLKREYTEKKYINEEFGDEKVPVDFAGRLCSHILFREDIEVIEKIVIAYSGFTKVETGTMLIDDPTEYPETTGGSDAVDLINTRFPYAKSQIEVPKYRITCDFSKLEALVNSPAELRKVFEEKRKEIISERIKARFNSYTRNNGEGVHVVPYSQGADRFFPTNGEKEALTEEDVLLVLNGLSQIIVKLEDLDKIDGLLEQVINVNYQERQSEVREEQVSAYSVGNIETATGDSIFITFNRDRLEQLVKEAEVVIEPVRSEVPDTEKVRQLFEIVESALNNNRARLVDVGNELVTFLAERDELPAEADLLLVLGSDDLEVAKGAAELYNSGKTKFKYVMCSGKGKGETPEGQKFTEEMIANGVPRGAFLLPETNSRFMGENLSLTAKQLAEAGKLSEIKSVVAVQKTLYNKQTKAAIGKNFVTEEGKVATQAGYVYAPSVPKMNTEKTSLELKDQMGEALAAADNLKTFGDKGFIDKVTLPPDVSSAAEKIREGINQLEADSIVTSLIVLARQAADSKDDNQKLIVGISTDWIPAYKDEHSFQYQATNSLVNKIKALPQALRSMGLNNVELVVEENSSTLASNVSKLALDSNARLSNVVVIASRESVEGGVFDGLRNEKGGEKALLAGMDSEGLMELYKTNGEISDKVLDIDIMEILALTLEVATGKTPPRKLLAAPYDSARRILILSPRATIKDYQKLRDINEGRKQALQAA